MNVKLDRTLRKTSSGSTVVDWTFSDPANHKVIYGTTGSREMWLTSARQTAKEMGLYIINLNQVEA